MPYITKIFENGKVLTADDMNNIIAGIDTLFQAIPFEIITFTSNISGIQEKGEVINEITLSWEINRDPKELKLDEEAISSAIKNINLTDLNLTSDKTWTLKATDYQDKTSQKTTSVQFGNGCYYSATSVPPVYNSEFIKVLTKKLSRSNISNFTVTADKDQFIYYCQPVSFGECEFKVGGFAGGFTLIDTIDFTNSLGYTEPYYIYKSVEPNLGTTKVEISKK